MKKVLDKPAKVCYDKTVGREAHKEEEEEEKMFEVYFYCEDERNETPEIMFNSYAEAEAWVLEEQDKYSEDCYFRIYDVEADRWD